jgi:uncharacterized protein YndB with AHSA1/START domain
VAENASKPTDTSDREIAATRVFRAPRELVFQLWTDPAHLVKWWGPTGFTTTMDVMDVRPGGQWRFTMHGPNGTDYPNKSVYNEVKRPERIVYTHAAPNFQAIVTFEEHGENGCETKLTMRMVFETAAERNRTVEKFNAVEGLHQTLGRLQQEVEKSVNREAGDADFVISRVFDAPRELVFNAWTDPKHMAAWWGPHQFTNPVCELDVRPGGKWRIVMRSPDGIEHPAKGIYIEVAPPERIVWTIDHSELPKAWHDMVNPNRPTDQGNPKLECVSTITFEDQGGKTKLTIRTRFESAAIRDSLLRIGMNEGWSQSLERLADETARIRS